MEMKERHQPLIKLRNKCFANSTQQTLPIGCFYHFKGSRLSGELWMIMKCWISGACCTYMYSFVCYGEVEKCIYLSPPCKSAMDESYSQPTSQPAIIHVGSGVDLYMYAHSDSTQDSFCGYLWGNIDGFNMHIPYDHSVHVWTAQDKDFDLQELHLDVHLSQTTTLF